MDIHPLVSWFVSIARPFQSVVVHDTWFYLNPSCWPKTDYTTGSYGYDWANHLMKHGSFPTGTIPNISPDCHVQGPDRDDPFLCRWTQPATTYSWQWIYHRYGYTLPLWIARYSWSSLILWNKLWNASNPMVIVSLNGCKYDMDSRVPPARSLVTWKRSSELPKFCHEAVGRWYFEWWVMMLKYGQYR